MMKAVFLTGVQQIEVHEIPSPQVPDDGFLLKVKACGVCGSDLRRWREGPPSGGLPTIPGHEIAGFITEVGKGAVHYKEGDFIAVAPDIHCGKCYYCRRGLYNLCDDLHFLGITPGYPGGFAEQMAITKEILVNGAVHQIPHGLSFRHAALAEPLSSVLAAHEKIGTGLGDTVLVMGGGPIGCLHLNVAKARGARVILSEPSPIRRQLAVPFNPDTIIDPLHEDVTSLVRSMTGNRGADSVICANPLAVCQAQAIETVRKGGKVVLFGGLPKANPMTTLDGNRIHYGEISVIGAFSYHPSFHEKALEIIHQGSILADQVISHFYPLEQTAQAFMTAAGGGALKVIVEM